MYDATEQDPSYDGDSQQEAIRRALLPPMMPDMGVPSGLRPAVEAATFRLPARIQMAYTAWHLLTNKQASTTVTDQRGNVKDICDGMKLFPCELSLLQASTEVIRHYITGEVAPLVVQNTEGDLAMRELERKVCGDPNAS